MSAEDDFATLRGYLGEWDETLGVEWHAHNEACEALERLRAAANAKQYPDGPLSPYDAACLRADEAEERAVAAEAELVKRPTLEEAMANVNHLKDKAVAAEADRDRLQHDLRMLAPEKWLYLQERDRYRDALEQINHLPFDVNKTAPEDLMAIKEIARAALATPDTPPVAPETGYVERHAGLLATPDTPPDAHTISCASRSWFDEKPGECDCGAETPPQHNHRTRDVKRPGVCPKCDANRAAWGPDHPSYDEMGQ